MFRRCSLHEVHHYSWHLQWKLWALAFHATKKLNKNQLVLASIWLYTDYRFLSAVFIPCSDVGCKYSNIASNVCICSRKRIVTTVSHEFCEGGWDIRSIHRFFPSVSWDEGPEQKYYPRKLNFHNDLNRNFLTLNLGPQSASFPWRAMHANWHLLRRNEQAPKKIAPDYKELLELAEPDCSQLGCAWEICDQSTLLGCGP